MQYKHFTTSIVALALAGAVQAAELGEIAPRSYIGQPLAVDIDLVSLTPEEVNGLQVRLAAQDVYRGANVAMNPALASVRMQVERRGGKPVLHVTTTRAVDADYLHLYVELGVPGKQEVRLATVWLQRDPNPPPPPTPVAPPVPLASAMTPAQAEQITAQARAARAAAATTTAAGRAAAGASGATAAGPGTEGGAAARTAGAGATASAPAGAGGAAGPAAPARDRSKPAPLPSVHEAETGAPGEVKAAAQARRIAGVLVSPDGKPIKPSARDESAEVPVGVSQALLPLAPLPLPKGVKRPAPASCPPGGASAKECVALDNHNAEISTKLTELESKLKVLQGALGGVAPAAKGAAPPAGHGEAASAHVATAKAAPAKPVASGAAPVTPAKSAASAEAPVAKPSAQGNASGAAAASASSAGADGKGAAAGQLSTSMAAQGETEMHAAKVAAGGGDAAASAAASVASVPTKQVRVLPKLKYKKEKEKPVEQPSSTWPLIAGGVGLLALLGGGLVLWRKKSAGRGPLKIWQGFRKKKVEEPDEEFKPVPEPASSTS